MKTKFLISSLFALLGLSVGQVKAQTQNSELKVWGEDVVMVADGKTVTYLTISETDNVDFTIINMSIKVPQGISVAKRWEGRVEKKDISICPDRVVNHTIDCNLADPTTIKVMLLSMTNQPLFHDDVNGNPVSDLFTIGLVADPSLAPGVYDIQIVDSKFIPVDGKTRIPQGPISFKMTVKGEAEPEVTVNSKLSAAGYGTLILPFDAQIPAGIEAFTCTGVVNGVVQTEKQHQITAHVPMLIKGTPGEYTFVGQGKSLPEVHRVGVLAGAYADQVITEGYVLQQLEGVTGFYPVNVNQPITVPAYRCYLEYAEKLQSIQFDGNLTGIEELQLDEAVNEYWYTLDGKRVQKVTTPGVYVRGNKKVIIK